MLCMRTALGQALYDVNVNIGQVTSSQDVALKCHFPNTLHKGQFGVPAQFAPHASL